MDLSWTPAQLSLKTEVARFAREELNGNLAELEKRGELDVEGWRKCAGLGIQGLPIPIAYGGGDADTLTTLCALESLGYGCRDNGLLFSINAHIWTCEIPILTFGTEAQKSRYLPRLCRGELIGGNAMSEPESGSDAYSLRTTAERDGDSYRLNGSKVFVTNAPIADLLLVFATVDRSKGAQGITAFLVERDAPGLSIGPTVEKMGLRTSPMAALVLDDCRVSLESRLGKEGAGVAIFSHSMEWERSCILATAVGAMQRQLEACVEYARQRRQFGQSIGKFQLVASKLVDMRVRLETARALLYKVGWSRQTGRLAVMEAAMAKLHISECWVQSCQDAVQLHGGYGYMTELGFERELRDALGSTLYSGTSEIQRTVIARLMGL